MVSLPVVIEAYDNISAYESKYHSRYYIRALSSSINLLFSSILFFNKVYAFGLIHWCQYYRILLLKKATCCLRLIWGNTIPI